MNKIYITLTLMIISSITLHAQNNLPEIESIPTNGRTAPKSILCGYTADPFVGYFDGKFYIYPTDDKAVWRDITQYGAWSSEDLVEWKYEGVIFDLAKDCKWAKNLAWAPAMAEKDGKYYFYFTAAPQIGVAVSNSPTGPFVDPIGKPLIEKGPRNTTSDKKSFGAIDPMVFIDDDGQAYLYAGICRCRVYPLNDDMISIRGDFKDITPDNFLEGTFVFKRKGKYYLTWSQFGTGSPYYSVWYGIGDSPMGPFEKQELPITWPQGEIKGPGHHAIVQVPGRDEWYIVYHYLTNNPERCAKTTENPHIGRETTISPMYFDEDGRIKRVDLYEPVMPIKLQ